MTEKCAYDTPLWAWGVGVIVLVWIIIGEFAAILLGLVCVSVYGLYWYGTNKEKINEIIAKVKKAFDNIK